MVIRKAYKYRLKVSKEIEQKLNRSAGANRYLWNKALAMQKDRLSRPFKEDRKRYSYYDLAAFLTLWKQSEEYGFLNEAQSQTLQQTLKDLERAIKDAFDKKQPNKRFPVFKQKGINDSFRYPQGFKVENNRVFLPKIGWLSFFKSREIEGEMKNVTVSRYGKHWYVSIQVEVELEEPCNNREREVGIDMGVVNSYRLSDEKTYHVFTDTHQWLEKLRKEQRKLSRKVKYSNNWKRQKQRIQSVHEQIKNKRYDRNHWISTQISREYGLVSIEKLKIANMTRSAKGDSENHGRNVKAKSGLNRSILNQGWGEFKRMMKYKMDWNGGYVVEVNAQYTSQTCHQCGHIAEENRESQSFFQCKNCGHTENADFNAAKNILAAGHAVMACGSNLNRGRKQELENRRESHSLLAA